MATAESIKKPVGTVVEFFTSRFECDQEAFDAARRALEPAGLWEGGDVHNAIVRHWNRHMTEWRKEAALYWGSLEISEAAKQMTIPDYWCDEFD